MVALDLLATIRELGLERLEAVCSLWIVAVFPTAYLFKPISKGWNHELRFFENGVQYWWHWYSKGRNKNCFFLSPKPEKIFSLKWVIQFLFAPYFVRFKWKSDHPLP